MTEPFLEIITEEDIGRRVAELAAEIKADYEGREPILVGVLYGSLPFLTDLARHLEPEIEIDFMALTRFGEEGRVGIAMDTSIPVEGRHVMIVEDIVDTGLTLATLRRLFEARGPASLAVVTLLDKVTRRIVEVAVEYRGFEVGDEFMLGYGLDWEGKYRNLSSIWAVMDLAAFHLDPGQLAAAVFERPGDRLSG